MNSELKVLLEDIIVLAADIDSAFLEASVIVNESGEEDILAEFDTMREMIDDVSDTVYSMIYD